MTTASLVGTPCQSARPHGRGTLPPSPDGRQLCGLPSHFLWYGVDPRFLDMTAAQRKRYIQSKLILCPDCAMELAHDFAWHIKDRKARLERLDMPQLRIACKACLCFTRIAWEPDAPCGFPGSIQFCPRCGARNAFFIDPEADYWDIMVEAFSTTLDDGTVVPFPKALLLMLYSEWPRNDRRYRRFADYVADQVKQYDEAGDFEAARNA